MSLFSELLGKSASDLRQEYHSLAKEQMNLRFQHAGKQLKNTAALRALRKKKARVKTAITYMTKKKD